MRSSCVLKRTIKDALSIIREKKDCLNLFRTDFHQSNADGFEILQHMEKEFMSMSPYDDTKLVPRGLSRTSNAILYFVKSLRVSFNDFKIRWENEYAQERGKTAGGQDSPLLDENMVPFGFGNQPFFNEVAQGDLKRKRRESQETTEKNDSTSDDSPNEKRQRVNWTDRMHQKFVEAIKVLGPERAVPKKILELMDEPGLTRESVASHLQKYRLSQRRAEEAMQSTGAVLGSELTTPHYQKYFSSINFAQSFNSSRGRYLYLNQLPYSASCPPGSIYSCLFQPEASTSASNLGHEQLLTGNYPYYGHRVSPFDSTTRNAENYYGFGAAPSNSQTGFGSSAQVDSGCLPGTLVKLKCETGFVPGIGNGQSNNVVSPYVGYRLACNGKSVETGQTFVLGDDVTAGGGNFSLVQNLLSLDDVVPQQQPSQPPVHSVEHDSEDHGADGEVRHLLGYWTSPDFTLEDHSILTNVLLDLEKDFNS